MKVHIQQDKEEHEQGCVTDTVTVQHASANWQFVNRPSSIAALQVTVVAGVSYLCCVLLQ